MKVSVASLLVLLPLVASSLNPKKLDNINNTNIILDDVSMHSEAPKLMWDKKELRNLVKELRHMDESESLFSDGINVEKMFLMKDEYTEDRDYAYYERLSNRIVSFANEAEIHGFEIGGAVSNLLDWLWDDVRDHLTPHLMKSNNVEVKAAVLSLCSTMAMWHKYFPLIKNDEKVQKRLLQVLKFNLESPGISILEWWGNLTINGHFCIIERVFDMHSHYTSNIPSINAG